MDQQQWEKINQIVDTALELEGKERSTFIKEKCTGNQDLKSQVTKLLEAIEQSDTQEIRDEVGDFMSQVAADVSRENDSKYASSLIGEIIDKYKILELIGHGGMGSVFMAERADGAYDRKVALKVLRRGMDTPSNIERFKRERNILARLNHPNIARLLDGGVTENGLPYLVMEYVDGTPLLQYCNNRQLSVERRLELFKSVCQAVQHAHRNATIHRDLKPSNIYVTDKGTVKVLDFGIAKLLEQNTAHTALFRTRTGARIMTLGYAAPEQIEGGTITTATDSYTLGILLFKLLTGCHPFDMEDKNLSNIEKLIRNQTPDNPSAKFQELPELEKTEIASQRDTMAAQLLQILEGDLDAIVLKALRKEPEARYRSVEQMLKDLNHYEKSLPLIAQSDTLRYRVGKFMRRNRNTAVGGILALIAIIGFGSYHINQISEERNIAQKEAQKAQTVKNFLIEIFRSSNPQSIQFQGKDVSAKQLLVTGENKIDKKLKDQPNIYVEVLLAIGDALQGIDAFKEAHKSYKKVIKKSPKTTNTLETKIRAYVKLGNLKRAWRSEAEAALKPALSAQKLLKSMSQPPSDLKAKVYSLLGSAHVGTESYDQANTYYEEADSIYTTSEMENSFDYIQMLSGYGKSLIYSSKFKKAKQVLLRSNKRHQEAFPKPTTTIAENYRLLGWVNRDLGNFKQSNDYFLKSIELYRSLTGRESMPTALSMYHLSINYYLSADYKKAEQLALKVLHIYKKLLDPSNDFRRNPKKYIAIAKYNQNQLSEAKKLLQEIIKTRTKFMGEGNINLAGPYSHLAVVHQKQGHFNKAVSLLKKSIRIYKTELGTYNRRMARAKIKLADVYREMGKYKLSRKYFQQVKLIHQKVVPESNHQNADFYLEYAKLKLDLGKPEQAQQYFQKAYSIYRDNFGTDNKRTKRAKSYLERIAQA